MGCAEGNFTASSAICSGGPPEAEIVQVHVTTDPGVLRRRMEERDTHRHPVHYDRAAAVEVAGRAAAGERKPLPLAGRLIRVDTTVWPNLDEVLAQI